MLIQWVHRGTMRTPLPHKSFFIDLNSIWFRQMLNKRSTALETGLFKIHKMPNWYKAKKKNFLNLTGKLNLKCTKWNMPIICGITACGS